MANKPLGLFVNRFETCTRGNFTAASAFGLFHVESLFADSKTSPIALTCYNNIKPKYDIFEAARVTQSSQSGIQGGTVLTFQQILKGMPLDVEKWQASIKIVYPVGSARYKAMFSQGKSVFNKGKEQNRVNAVQTLITTIGSDASLATIKGVIETFYTAMTLAYSIKGTSKKSTKTDSTAIEAARIDMCDEMEGNFGLLIAANKKNPSLVAKYFDESYMNNKLQTTFNLKVKKFTTKNAIKRTFANPLAQQFHIISRANNTMKIFLSASRYGLVGTKFVSIPPESTGIYNLSEMGDNATESFLNIFNPDERIKGDITIKVL